MRILIACETSGALRERFRALGHDCWSVDLLESDSGPNPYHIVGDALEAAASRLWDMVIAHPPCTYLCSSGLHWNGRVEGRSEKTDAALAFVKALWALPVERLAIENPVGCINTRLAFMPRPQYIQPYDFGDDASKRTGLWTRGLPPLEANPGSRVAGRKVLNAAGNIVERWGNQTDSGQNRLAPSADRWKARSKTYAGVADAITTQWGNL